MIDRSRSRLIVATLAADKVTNSVGGAPSADRGADF